MTEPISLRISANERGTAPERFGAIIMATERHSERWNVTVDGEAEVDLVFSLEDRSLGVELKTPQDFVGSLQGHLSEQRRNSPYPLRIAVLGSLGDVMRAVPEVTVNGWQNPRERAKSEAQIRRDISSLKASGVEVDFGVSYIDFLWNYDRGFKAATVEDAKEFALVENVSQILHDARAILLGDVALRMPKCESWQEYCLRGLPGVGPDRARAILAKGMFPRIVQYAPDPGRSPAPFYGVTEAELRTVDGVGPKVAAKIKTAEQIMAAMR